MAHMLEVFGCKDMFLQPPTPTQRVVWGLCGGARIWVAAAGDGAVTACCLMWGLQVAGLGMFCKTCEQVLGRHALGVFEACGLPRSSCALAGEHGHVLAGCLACAVSCRCVALRHAALCHIAEVRCAAIGRKAPLSACVQ